MNFFSYSLDEDILRVEQKDRHSNFKVYFSDQEIFEFSDYSHAVRGDALVHPKLGNLELKLVGIKEGFSIILNGKHHYQSAMHPRFELKQVGILSILMAGMFLVHILFTINIFLSVASVPDYAQSTFNILFYSAIGYYGISFLAFIISIYFSYNGKAVSIILSLIFVALNILLVLFAYLFNIADFDMITLVFFVLKVIILGLLISKIKLIPLLRRNKQTFQIENAEILEDIE